jgi:uncharacterized membrane protein YeaQ/YmgE (transglycosylase-associated protein family)
MGIIRMLIVGLIVGILARFFYPGAVPLNWLWSIVLGIAGSFVAGFVLQLVNRKAGDPFHPAGFLASIVGAMLLIFLAKTFHVLL